MNKNKLLRFHTKNISNLKYENFNIDDLCVSLVESIIKFIKNKNYNEDIEILNKLIAADLICEEIDINYMLKNDNLIIKLLTKYDINYLYIFIKSILCKTYPMNFRDVNDKKVRATSDLVLTK